MGSDVMKKILFLILSTLILTACGVSAEDSQNSDLTPQQQAEIPTEYKGLTNPYPNDAESIQRGAELYKINCESCHGVYGLGNGPAGMALVPTPAPIVRSAQIMGDDYLFWRITEGGTPFGTSMPSWKTLSEQDRWDLINYIHSMGGAK